MSLIALFWNFLLMICNFLLLFSRSKNIRMSSTLIRVIITYQLLIIIIIIIIIINNNNNNIITTKCHSNYCSVGVAVMELCLSNLLILIVFCVILTLVCSLRACHMGLYFHLQTWFYVLIRNLPGFFST